MPTNERPGVYTGYEVSRAVSGSEGGGIVGLVAQSGSGSAQTLKIITSYSEAVTQFGTGGNMTPLIRLLLENGAAAVHAVSAASGSVPTTANYTSAFAILAADSAVQLLTCDSTDAAVHSAMRSSIAGASAACAHRIGIVEARGDTTALTSAAAALNSERMVLVSPGSAMGGNGSFAAAFAGAVAGQTDPAVPFNGTELLGLSDSAGSFDENAVNLLLRGGVTPIEAVGSKKCVIRAVTTRTTTNSVADSTWRELNTILIVDAVIPTVKAALASRFSRCKNTLQTRGAIRTQVLIELESFLAREIIESYSNILVSADTTEPTTCNVEFSFTVAHGLNQIHLTAHITV